MTKKLVPDLLAVSLLALVLTACATAPIKTAGTLKKQGVQKVLVKVDVIDTGSKYKVESNDVNDDKNNDPKRHRLQERAGYLEWKFSPATPEGGIARFRFAGNPEYDFDCTLSSDRRCESNTFVIPCSSNANIYTMEYTILFEFNGKKGDEDPWVVIEK